MYSLGTITSWKPLQRNAIEISAEIMFAGHDFNKWNMADVFIWLYVYLYHLWVNMSIICLSFVFRQLGTNLVIPGGSKTIEVKGKLIMPGKKISTHFKFNKKKMLLLAFKIYHELDKKNERRRQCTTVVWTAHRYYIKDLNYWMKISIIGLWSQLLD